MSAPNPTSPRVAVILLNFNGTDDTLACLQSLQSLDYPHYQVIVVDNASDENPQARIQQAYPGVTLIHSRQNLGYSGGNNLGIQCVLEAQEADFIWLLNNDATVQPDTLTQLLKLAGQYPFDIIGSRILYPDGRFQRIGNRLDKGKGGLKSYKLDDVQDGDIVESLSGCSMLVPRMVFEVIGLLSEDYFLYFEDNDFCLRAAQAGFKSRVALQSLVYHAEGATTGRNRPLVTYYYQRNRLRLCRRFFSSPRFKLIALYTQYRLFRSTIKTAIRRSAEAEAHHRAFRLAVKDFYQGITGACPHAI